MARITMRNSQKATFAEVFEIYISAVTARGVKDKTIATYKQHFHAISKRWDVSLPINRLNSTVLDNMILQMRKEGLSDSSINSYTRTLKCFLSWCNEEGYTKANQSFYWYLFMPQPESSEPFPRAVPCIPSDKQQGTIFYCLPRSAMI